AGSLAVLLLWVYYSAQIFLLGAEFTQVWAHAYGSRRTQARPNGVPRETVAPPVEPVALPARPVGSRLQRHLGAAAVVAAALGALTAWRLQVRRSAQRVSSSSRYSRGSRSTA